MRAVLAAEDALTESMRLRWRFVDLEDHLQAVELTPERIFAHR
jgi:hypothetical protein